VSQLKKCLRVPTEAIDSALIQLESDPTYPEHPIKIIDRKDRITRRTTNRFYKVQWSNHSEEEATWEKEEFLRSKYPDFLNAHPGTSSLHLLALYFFSLMRESRDEIPLRGEGCNTPVLLSANHERRFANLGVNLVISVNRVRVVKHCLAVFDLIFLNDPSFNPTFAQNKSCSSSCPLQLLF